MLWERKNLLAELQQERLKWKSSAAIMDEVAAILQQNQNERQAISKRLRAKSSTNANDFAFDELQHDRIFHLNQIRKICVDYRFRFLDSHRFRGHIPEEAISAIRELEKVHATALNGFKIAAPSSLFQLDRLEDPLLFAPIGNGYYYLVHQWGGDVNPWRKWLTWPVRHVGHFVLTLVVLSILFTAWLPPTVAGIKTPTPAFQVLSFLFVLKSIVGISLYYCIWQRKNFNDQIWNQEFH